MSSRLWDSKVKLLPPDYQFIAVAHQGFPRQGANLLLLPATKLGQGNIFRSVCQEFCSQGVLLRHSPSQEQAPPHPHPGAGTPPEQCMLGDTGNKRAVRILLECILVYQNVCRKLHENSLADPQGGDKDAPLPLRVQIHSFSCSFRLQICKIIG